MPFCVHCGVKNEDSAKFCAECGKTAGEPSQLQQTMKAKWAEPYFRGTMKANTSTATTTGEIWTYDRGTVKCTEGNPKGTIYLWDGSAFRTSNENLGQGSFDGQRLQWSFPVKRVTFVNNNNSNKDSFYSYTWDEATSFQNEFGIFRTEPIRYTSFVHWRFEKDIMSVAEGSDFKEGAATSWEVQGNVPPPVVLFIAMFSRAEKLLEEVVQRSKRCYKRCGKLVLSSAGAPVLCAICASNNDDNSTDFCICCDRPCTGNNNKFQGKICKTCAPRKAFCIKCADPVSGGTGKEGFLCSQCGLGKTSDNCCKMTFTIK